MILSGIVLKSAKGTDACHQTGEELATSSGGTLDPVPVLREFLKKIAGTACRQFIQAAAVVVLLLGLNGLGWAQSGRGSVTGTVRDSSGAAIPGADVTVINSATNQTYTLTTNETGNFTAADVPVGTYLVRVQKQGFDKSEISGLTVDSGATARADATMRIGQARQTIEVQAAALQVDSEDSQSAVTVNQTLVNTLPLVVAGTVRSPFDLASLTPGSQKHGKRGGFRIGRRPGGQLSGDAGWRFDRHFAGAAKELGDFECAIG